MTSLAKKLAGAPIPLYSLYGRVNADAEPRFVHLGALEQGNENRDWNILAHRHHDLYQFIWVSDGYGTVELDTRTLHLESPVLIYIPPLVVHGFRWNPGSEGLILTVAGALLGDLVDQSGAPEIISARDELLVVAGSISRRSDASEIKGLFESILEEYIGNRLCREVVISSDILILLAKIVRLRQSYRNGGLTSETFLAEVEQRSTYRRFEDLVERHFRERFRVVDYAYSLAISVRSLDRLCLRLAARTPSQIVQGRIVLEAKRDLIYTDKTIAEIGYGLGFDDPSYFTKFFVRNEGVAPAAFRQAGRIREGQDG